MPLNTKDDVNEAPEEAFNDQQADGRPGGGSSARVSELEQRLDELEEAASPPEQHESVGAAFDTAYGYADAAATVSEEVREEVEELRDRVEQQEAVIHELVEMTEILSSAANWRELQHSMEVVADEGSDGYWHEWEPVVHEFKERKYE